MQHPIEEKIPGLPTGPGVYIMRGVSDRVLYVGKAKNLRARLRSYVGAQAEAQLKTRFLLPKVKSLETIVTRTEKEALLLENSLIKQYRPRYNVRLVDDKTYLNILLDRNHLFPRLVPVRRPGPPKPGQQVFGPYPSAQAVRDTLRQIQRLYPLRTCKDREFRLRSRPCLQAQMGRCAGACTGAISPQAYADMVDQAVLILQGRNEELLRRQQARMKEASDALRFEEAARIRDRVEALRSTLERQRVVDVRAGNRDVIGVCREGTHAEVALLRIRGGNLQERLRYALPDVVVTPGELLRSFVLQVYAASGLCPPAEVLLCEEPEDRETLEEVLAERRDGPCSLKTPLRGEKRRLVELAVLNAKSQMEEHEGVDRSRRAALAEIRRKTGMERHPERIECFDISSLQGTFAVGSCAVFLNGEPSKDAYRRYRIRVPRGSDDYAMMLEVLRRRLERGKVSGELPDLLLVDGGKGHLHVAVEALRASGVQDVWVAALAKGRDVAHRIPRPKGSRIGTMPDETVQGGMNGEVPGPASRQENTFPEEEPGEGRQADRVFVPGRANPVNFSRSVGGLRILQQIRDEAHRFALAYHRRLRSREMERSALDAVPGIGKRRKQALLTALGDVEAVRQASVHELARVPGMNERTALTVWGFLHPEEQAPAGRPLAMHRSVR